MLSTHVAGNIQRSWTELCTLVGTQVELCWRLFTQAPQLSDCRTKVVEKIQPSPMHVSRQITPLRHGELTSNIFLTPKYICVPWNGLRRLSIYTEPSNNLKLVWSHSAAASKHSDALPRPHTEPSRCMLPGFFPTNVQETLERSMIKQFQTIEAKSLFPRWLRWWTIFDVWWDDNRQWQ
jgi:hypothetical protein